jgi:FkbM family methyltransferase
VKLEAQVLDRVEQVLDWLAAHMGTVRVFNIGLLGLPGGYADLGPRIRTISCDPLADGPDISDTVVRAVAVSAYGGTEELNVTRDPDRSSLLEPNWAVVSRYGESASFEVVDQRAVPSVTLSGLVGEHGPADVLRLHCQGLEYQLISSALETVSEAVCVEVCGGLVDNYVGQYPLAAVTTLLQGVGYALVDLECSSRPRTGWGGPGRHPPVEYRGLWFRDQAPNADHLDFASSIKLLMLSRALGHLSFGQQLASAMYGQSLIPPDLAGTLCAVGFWHRRWDLRAPVEA